MLKLWPEKLVVFEISKLSKLGLSLGEIKNENH